jgi:hypothetical protein
LASMIAGVGLLKGHSPARMTTPTLVRWSAALCRARTHYVAAELAFEDPRPLCGTR